MEIISLLGNLREIIGEPSKDGVLRETSVKRGTMKNLPLNKEALALKASSMQ
jgi:hypothetical protein